jgi:hypothetical protein
MSLGTLAGGTPDAGTDAIEVRSFLGGYRSPWKLLIDAYQTILSYRHPSGLS